MKLFRAKVSGKLNFTYLEKTQENLEDEKLERKKRKVWKTPPIRKALKRMDSLNLVHFHFSGVYLEINKKCVETFDKTGFDEHGPQL